MTALKQRYPLYLDDLNEIVELLVETVCAKRKTTRISGADFPHEIVRSRFLKLDSSHIEFVMDCLQKNTTQVRNMKQYLLAVLFNTAPLEPCNSPQAAVEQLYNQLNNDHPADYHHPSMSVSDIVAIKQDGKVSCHYCDSVGFTQIPGFLPENPLKNAEMAVEDDYGMIDGIINNGAKEPTVAELEQQARSGQPISLMDLADAVHREEREKKKSVVDQLKSQPKAEHKKTAPKKSAEREI